jgi:Bacteriophage lambda head decoration protein D
MTYNYRPGYRKIGEHNPRTIRLGNSPIRRDSAIIEQGQKLLLGSVLGRKTATGKCVLCAKTKEDGTAVADGSEKPIFILEEDVDASKGDQTGAVFRTCAAFGLDLIVGKGHTIESVTEDLALRGIFIDKGEDLYA